MEKLTAVNSGDSHQDTRSAPKRAHQVGSDGQQSKNGTTESGSSGDDALQLLVHALFTVAGHDHLLVLELLSNFSWARARDFNPCLGKERAGSDHEGDVDRRMNRVEQGGLEGVGCRHVVGDTRDSVQLRRVLHRLNRGCMSAHLETRQYLSYLPDTEELDKEVVGEAVKEHLADDKDVRGQGTFQHDRHVGGVEEFDRI